MRMISAGVNINARNPNGWSGLYIAMATNNTEAVSVLLACSGIRLDVADIISGMTSLHIACHHNYAECVRLLLTHPACTKQIVTMVDKEGETAEMTASTSGSHGCVIMIKEFLDKPDPVMMMIESRLGLGDVGVAGVEPAMLEGMTLIQIGDAIEKMAAFKQTMEEGKNTMRVEHKQELDKLELEQKTLIANHQRKLNTVLNKHVEEKNLYENYCTEKKSQKQILEAEVQQRLQDAQPAPPASLIPECPICMESMKPPMRIFNCSNGHWICSICRLKCHKCHCEALYVGRATAMEQMVRQMISIM
jgi:hypothetical protein